MKYRIIFLFLAFAAFSAGLRAQNYYRLRVDITVKKKNFDGTYSLTKGTVYYDNITKKLVMDLWFPYKERYVMYGNMIYKFKDGKFVSAAQNPAPPETSIFALVLKNNLQYYGLENSGYTLADIEEDNGLVISTWLPPQQLRKAVGKLMIANKDGLITGIIFMSVDDDKKVVSKQFFEDYVDVQGIKFPTKMVQLLYDPQNNESIQQTEFKNIVIDEKAHDDIYDFPVERYAAGAGQ
jgi:hypothetical protein